MLTGRSQSNSRSRVFLLCLSLLCLSALTGCSRQFWRQQADTDAYAVIGEKLNDPHWDLPRVNVTPDSRSRFYDPYDPDQEPLPPDDPAAHEVMHSVSGRKGYNGWHKLGVAFSIENPQWLAAYGIESDSADPVSSHADLQLLEVSVPDAMDLALIHNPEYQTQLESLYSSALNLTEERFRLGARYLVGGGPPVMDASFRTNSQGKGSAALTTPLGIRQTLPGGAQIAADVANTMTWVFSGEGTQTSAPGIGYSVTQPLLFRAGRKIVLENLTQAERDVLYRVRSLARFRQNLFTSITISYLNLLAQKQRILNERNNIRALEDQLESQRVRDARVPGVVSAALEGFEGLEIPESLQEKLGYDQTWLKWEGDLSEDEERILLGLSDNSEYLAAAAELVDFKRQQTTSLSYLQLRGRLNSSLSRLASTKTSLEDRHDQFKSSLGLPPNIELEINGDLLDPFELISWDLIELETDVKTIQKEIGRLLLPQQGPGLDDSLSISTVRDYVAALLLVRDQLQEVGIDQVRRDFEPLHALLERTSEDFSVYEVGQRYFRSEDERNALQEGLVRDERLFRLAEREFRFGSSMFEMLQELLKPETKEAMLQALDSDADGRIQASELPDQWGELPRTGAQSIAESYSVDELLVEIAAAARDLRDKYLLRMAQSLEVLQASLRVESVPLVPFSLDGSMRVPNIDEVVSLALEYRHDLMNARAEVMDARRAVEISANALEAGLDVVFSGNQGLNANTRSQTGHRAGLRFTTPIDQISERNAYRRAQISFQQARRRYMETEDSVKQSVRGSWRQLQVLEYRFLIDRSNVRNAALQYDSASLQAAASVRDDALNLTSSLSNVLEAQNSLASNWVAYETNRLNIFRDMGIMEIDARGMWTDEFYVQLLPASTSSEDSLMSPPAVPETPKPADNPEEADAAGEDLSGTSSI